LGGSHYAANESVVSRSQNLAGAARAFTQGKPKPVIGTLANSATSSKRHTRPTDRATATGTAATDWTAARTAAADWAAARTARTGAANSPAAVTWPVGWFDFPWFVAQGTTTGNGYAKD